MDCTLRIPSRAKSRPCSGKPPQKIIIIKIFSGSSIVINLFPSTSRLLLLLCGPHFAEIEASAEHRTWKTGKPERRMSKKARKGINIKRHERPPGRDVEGRDRPQRHPATARNPTPPGQEPTQSGAIELPRGRPSSPRAPLERPSSPRGDRAPPRATAQICPLPLPHATRAAPS